MNSIEQLTRNYINSLHLSDWGLSQSQKQKIIDFNVRTNWIIFYTNSISYVNNPHGGQGYYRVDSGQLQELLQAQIKIYHKEDWKEDTFMLDRGDSRTIEDVKVKRLVFVAEGADRIWSSNSWIAINKTAAGDGLGETFMEVDSADLTIGKSFRKVEYDLDNLLNSDNISNSTAPSSSGNKEEEDQGGTGVGNNQNATKQDLTFTIDYVMEGYNGEPSVISLDNGGIEVQGTKIYLITIASNNHLLVDGNEITIKEVEFGPGKAEIDPRAHDITIRNHFGAIERANTGSGGGVGGSSTDLLKQAKQKVIDEIRDALKNHGFSLSGSEVGDFPTNWETDPANFASLTDIPGDKTRLLDKIYRQAAVNKVKKTAANKGLSITILNLSNNNLVQYFENFSGEANIQKEAKNLITILNNYSPDRLAEIDAAIAEIRTKLAEAGISSEQVSQILGNAWETNYRTDLRYETSQKVDNYKQGILDTIDRYLDQSLARGKKIIAEIKKILQESGLSESILGEDWQTILANQDQNEQESTKSRLLKLIEQAINSSTDLTQEEKNEKVKEIVIKSIASVENSIQTKLTNAHPKLVVSEVEIPTVIFAPCRTLEERLNSIFSINELNDLKDKCLKAIDEKRKEKLTALQEKAIQEIQTAFKNASIELISNENLESTFKGMVDPDQIESKKEIILKSIREQNQTGFSNEQSSNNPSSNWSKTLGIAALIIAPLVIIGLLVLRFQKLRLNRKLKP